jgi:hypothetical protein
MILRRVADQVREHDWFVVAIEFVIVVLGVFLGLQASNWNEARLDRAIAAGHLAEIAEDLQAHLDFHDRLYGSAVARISAADYLLRAAGKAAPPPSVVAVVRDHEDFAAYVRTTREWAIVHAQLLEDLRVETEALLSMIRAELATPT